MNFFKGIKTWFGRRSLANSRPKDRYVRPLNLVVMAMGYVAEDEIPSYLLSKLNFEQICNKDLNWKLMPSGNKVVNFITEDYDVLIDLSLEDHIPVQHLVASSRAKFKVGRLGEVNENLFDMMIDMAGVQSLSQYIAQVDKYLHMVNAQTSVTT